MAPCDRLWPTLSLYAASTKRDRQRLASWKAIARHLGCSVRTARRWEQQEGLPVHRQMHRVQANVYAYADELVAWRNRFETTPGAPRSGGVMASEPADASLAVMPFAFVGPDNGSNFIADGLIDELIARLSRIPALKVICRTSSMTLKETDLPARDIARKLAVNHLLEGTVRLAEQRLRVTVRLVDPRQDLATWSDQFDGKLGDVFDLQESIARWIAGALELRLTRQEERLLSRPPADGADVWQCVQRSRQAALRWRPDSIDDAVGLLEQGIQRFGERTSLLAALGRTHLQYGEAGLGGGAGGRPGGRTRTLSGRARNGSGQSLRAPVPRVGAAPERPGRRRPGHCLGLSGVPAKPSGDHRRRHVRRRSLG
jgi:TolB-like protein